MDAIGEQAVNTVTTAEYQLKWMQSESSSQSEEVSKAACI